MSLRAHCIQARNLQAFGELPTNARINQTAVDMAMDGAEGAEEDMGFDFEDVSYMSFELFVWRCGWCVDRAVFGVFVVYVSSFGAVAVQFY